MISFRKNIVLIIAVFVLHGLAIITYIPDVQKAVRSDYPDNSFRMTSSDEKYFNIPVQVSNTAVPCEKAENESFHEDFSNSTDIRHSSFLQASGTVYSQTFKALHSHSCLLVMNCVHASPLIFRLQI